MLISIIVLLALLAIALITIYVIQEDNRAQQDFIECQGALIDQMRPHLSHTYFVQYFKDATEEEAA